LWKVIRLATLLQRGANLNPIFNPAPEALEMVTSQAAQVLGLDDRIGSLEVGKHADLITIDLDQPHLVPLYDYYSHLVYAVGREDVNTVMINGKLVMRDRELLTVDEELSKSQARILSEGIRPLRG